jgi:hypothetical protein
MRSSAKSAAKTVMKTVIKTGAKTAIAIGFVGALAIGATAPAAAFYISGPGFHVWIGHHHARYYDYYRGPVGGGGWNTWNGCPPNYTIQDGVCKPYRGY